MTADGLAGIAERGTTVSTRAIAASDRDILAT